MWTRRMHTNFGAPHHVSMGAAPGHTSPEAAPGHTSPISSPPILQPPQLPMKPIDPKSSEDDASHALALRASGKSYVFQELPIRYVVQDPAINVMRSIFYNTSNDALKLPVWGIESSHALAEFYNKPEHVTELDNALTAIVPRGADQTFVSAFKRIEIEGAKSGHPLAVQQALTGASLESAFFKITGTPMTVDKIPTYVITNESIIKQFIENQLNQDLDKAVRDDVVNRAISMFKRPFTETGAKYVPLIELATTAQNFVNFRTLFEGYTDNTTFNKELHSMNSDDDMAAFVKKHHSFITAHMDAKINSLYAGMDDSDTKTLVRDRIITAMRNHKFVSIEKAMNDTNAFLKEKRVDLSSLEGSYNTLFERMQGYIDAIRELERVNKELSDHLSDRNANHASVQEAEARLRERESNVETVLDKMTALRAETRSEASMLIHLCGALTATLDVAATHGSEVMKHNMAQVNRLQKLIDSVAKSSI